MSAFYVRGPRLNPGPGIGPYFLFAYSHLLHLQNVLAAIHAALINYCESSAAHCFFAYGQSSSFLSYSVALSKHLIGGSVLAG